MNIRNTKNLISVGIGITVLPAYLYLITYMYELGACVLLKVPTYLIEISISNLLAVGVTITFLGYLFVQLFFLIMPINNLTKNPKYKHLKMVILPNTICAVIFAIVLIIDPFTWAIVLNFLVFFAVANLFYGFCH